MAIKKSSLEWKRVIYLMVIILIAGFLLYENYPCLKSGGDVGCLLNFSTSFYFIMSAVIFVLLVLSFKDNIVVFLYYLMEFFIVFFGGVYGIKIIQSALNFDVFFESFVILNMFLFIATFASFLYLRYLFGKASGIIK